jgi:hypothetical protein
MQMVFLKNTRGWGSSLFLKENLSTKQVQWCGVLNIFAEIHKEPSVLPICTLWEALSRK